ncbi:peptide/nickel transport system ATP-binding protein [Nocardiopsis sp. Huas11]|uniref:ABC transporter ATP-binding protein n=1 Tax=Nocardiopsis sp. Huas11 TaxID=2183912 RepID=UPI000EAD60F1|nr:ATP-binding cassette domain-containing protein [Nocardiopsis sp. Huas11]RKS09348.1 peptide/nickel transport system ATP-binding protein [Nocardiopsis sp. Huas11]
MTTTPILCVSDLTVAAADGTVLVDGFSLTARPGETVALTGPSGCGKSTAVLGILDALTPGTARVRGSVRWRGAEIRPGHAARRWRRRHTGVLTQDPVQGLNPLCTVETAVREGGGARTPLTPLLASLGLDAEDVLRRRTHTLSGGQAQRVALARAVLSDPALLVLDEPTSGLDAAAVALVAREIGRRRARGGLTLVVSHDPVFTASVADRIIAFDPPHPVERAAPVTPRPFGAPATAPGRARAVARPVRGAPAAAGADPVLRLAGVAVGHPGRPVLDEVSLDLRPGELVAVTGPSGSGKSTLLRAVAGLHAPARGRILLHGTPLAPNVGRRDPAGLRGVQFVAQDPAGALNHAHTAGAAVARPSHVLRSLPGAAARAEAAALLARVGLDPAVGHRTPGALSGGQRQRVALARALAAGPDVLLADEITSALDPAATTAVLDLLSDLCRTGLAVLVATHEPGVAARADRILTVEGRTLRLQPPPAEHRRTETTHARP